MKNLLIAGIILVCMVLGFTVPADLMELKDEQRLWQVTQKKTEEVSMSCHTNMTFSEKIRFMQEDEVTTIQMSGGKNFTEEEMIVQAQKELKELQNRGIIWMSEKVLVYSIQRILCQMDVQDGNRSIFLWEVTACSEDGEIRMLLDDETGKILNIYHIQMYEKIVDSTKHVEMATKEKIEYTEDLEQVAAEWADYWEVELIAMADYSVPAPIWDEEKKAEAKMLVEKGLSEEDAWNIVCEEWGISEDEISERCMYAVFEDEAGMAPMNFRKNTREILFMIEGTINYGKED